MRRSFLLKTALILALAGASEICAAQSSATGRAGTSSRPRSALPGGERSMRGCIARDETGGYILQSLRGAKVKLSSADDLSKHVDHEVKVSGAFVDTGDPAPGSAGRSGKPHAERAFRVLRLDTISPDCKLAPGKRR